MDLKIEYDPNASQSAFHGSNSQYKAMVGALGSGKTATLCVEAIALLVEYPGNVGLLSRKSLPELKSTTLKRFFDFLPDVMIQSYNKTDRELYVKTSGKPSLLHFGPLDDISRYKSLELGFFGIDEADETTEDHWLTLCGRLRMKNVPTFGMIATNPTSTNHWIYKNWVVTRKPSYELFRSKTSDNEVNLPEGYMRQLMDNYPPDWIKRYVEGHFGVIQMGDPVFPEFRENVNVKHVVPTSGTIMRGWDFGRRYPCVVFAQFDDVGKFKVFKTLLGENEDLYQFSDRVLKVSRQWFPGAEFEDFCDIAGKQERDSGKSSISILNDKRIYPKYRYSRPEDRCREIRKMIRERAQDGEDVFQVDPCNLYLIEAFLGGYAVDHEGLPKKDGYFDNGMDAMGYIIANTCMVASPMADLDLEISEPKWSYRGAQ